ncbi:MAG: RHS repeat-associated core domain-containing protein, partial [Candidatus Methylomirabilales bacterium]
MFLAKTRFSQVRPRSRRYSILNRLRDKPLLDPSFVQPFAFTGREWDRETGLHYYRARYYDPKIGRFVSDDPIGFAGGDANLYAYVWNAPMLFLDPLGLAGNMNLGQGYTGRMDVF